MASEISCDICRDLLPLVQDGVASEDSRAAVEAHLRSCPACRALAGDAAPPPPDGQELLRRIRRQLRGALIIVLLAGILFGLELTEGVDMFYNSLLMPALGAVGYLVYRWKALWRIPLLLLVLCGVVALLKLLRGLAVIDAASLLIWTGIYCLFALIGVLIAGLLHFALKKEG